MPKLSVNVNKIATLRNTRQNEIPNVVRLARLALEAGAHGITIHPRPDQRHIRPRDVDALAEQLRAHPQAELSIEGNPFPWAARALSARASGAGTARSRRALGVHE